MKNWGQGQLPTSNSQQPTCSWITDERDARRVAARLGIPFYVLNFEREYYARVFEPFLAGIKRGVTPNPDVFCNQEIKFGVFLEKALEIGADMVATGHYARVGRPTTYDQRLTTRYKLLKAKDKSKDQTYFLYRLNQFQLSKTLFPIGDYLKTEVRALAREFGLPTYNKPDSQGICFVGQAPFAEFMAQYIPRRQGVIVSRQGKQLGTHQGTPFYTIGQRKGLGIGGLHKPLFIAQKDIKQNTLVAVEENDALLYAKSVSIGAISWVSGKAPADKKFSCQVRFRHQQPLQAATVYQENNKKARILFTKKQRAITPGQSLVLYKGQSVLGGGIIVK